MHKCFTTQIVINKDLEYEQLKTLEKPSLEYRKARGILTETVQIIHGKMCRLQTVSVFVPCSDWQNSWELEGTLYATQKHSSY